MNYQLNTLKKRFFQIAIGFLFFCIISCGHPDNDKFIGQWQEQEGNNELVWDFSDDGIINHRMTGSLSQSYGETEWYLMDGNRIHLRSIGRSFN